LALIGTLWACLVCLVPVLACAPAPDEATRRRVETRDREEDEEQGDEDEELYRVCWGTNFNFSEGKVSFFEPLRDSQKA
jgi:hypothetical protein